MKAFSYLRRGFAPRKLFLGSLLLPSAMLLYNNSNSFSFQSVLSSFGKAICINYSYNAINFQEIRDTLFNSWKGILATEMAQLRVPSNKLGQQEKVKQILERDKNIVDLIKDNSASVSVILIPKDFQKEGFVAAFASHKTKNLDSKKVLYIHSQNTVMDPEFVPSFLRQLSQHQFASQSHLFIIDAQALIEPGNKNSFSSLKDLAQIFKDKPNLKTYIFASLKENERERRASGGTALIDLFAYFREQAEHYARTLIDTETTISQFIALQQLDKCNKVFRMTRRLQIAPRIYSQNSIVQELMSCVVDGVKGVWAVLKLSFYFIFGIFYFLALIGKLSTKKQVKPDKVDEILQEKNLGYMIRDYKGRESCPICLEQIKRVAFLTACKHLFHLECIRDWVKRNSNCPLCRRPVALKLQKDFL